MALKLEKDSLKVRVGGGFLSIDEFLDQYTPTELDKLDRADPPRRTANGGDYRTNPNVRRISPIGTACLPPGRSPRRGATTATTPGRNSNRGGGLTPVKRVVTPTKAKAAKTAFPF